MFQPMSLSPFQSNSLSRWSSTVLPTERAINDPIHGYITLEPRILQIIDTPQFQRLRDLKQLGSCYYVFPGAAHNRFEHSIGVHHLADILLNSLRRNQTELDISDHEIFLVKTAALCHDLGHGPFSHVFDNEFIPRARQDLKATGREWSHEQASIMMLDQLIDDHNLDFSTADRRFVHELINPYHFKPWSNERQFLYQVVSNPLNSIDVDKYDYLARDSHNLGLSYNYKHDRLIRNIRVIDNEICFNSKEVYNLYEMFHTRYSLHKMVYTHRVTKAVDFMIIDALLLADPVLKISDAIDDPRKYLKLTDYVLKEIENSESKELEDARNIVQRLRKRQLYKLVEEWLLAPQAYGKINVSEKDIVGYAPAGSNLRESDLIVYELKLNYAMKDKNPIQSVHFFRKENPNRKFCIGQHKVSFMIPERFEERYIRIFVRDPEKLAPAKIAAKAYLKINAHVRLANVEDEKEDDIELSSYSPPMHSLSAPNSLQSPSPPALSQSSSRSTSFSSLFPSSDPSSASSSSAQAAATFSASAAATARRVSSRSTGEHHNIKLPNLVPTATPNGPEDEENETAEDHEADAQSEEWSQMEAQRANAASLSKNDNGNGNGNEHDATHTSEDSKKATEMIDEHNASIKLDEEVAESDLDEDHEASVDAKVDSDLMDLTSDGQSVSHESKSKRRKRSSSFTANDSDDPQLNRRQARSRSSSLDTDLTDSASARTPSKSTRTDSDRNVDIRVASTLSVTDEVIHLSKKARAAAAHVFETPHPKVQSSAASLSASAVSSSAYKLSRKSTSAFHPTPTSNRLHEILTNSNYQRPVHTVSPAPNKTVRHHAKVSASVKGITTQTTLKSALANAAKISAAPTSSASASSSSSTKSPASTSASHSPPKSRPSSKHFKSTTVPLTLSSGPTRSAASTSTSSPPSDQHARSDSNSHSHPHSHTAHQHKPAD